MAKSLSALVMATLGASAQPLAQVKPMQARALDDGC